MDHITETMDRPRRVGVSRIGIAFVGLAILAAPLAILPAAHAAQHASSQGAQAGPQGTQVTAANGSFWLGPNPITFHGGKLVNDDPPAYNQSQTDTYASWGMNFVRFHIHWAELENTYAPVRQQDGSWKHTWNDAYLDKLKTVMSTVRADGMYALITSSGDASAYFGYPDWLYTAAYNSHGITYPQTPDGAVQAQTDMWNDDLRQQFFIAFWKHVASYLAGTGNIVGYEIWNEPSGGDLLPSQATTQTILDWQLKVAQGIRATDPPRVIMFTTHNGFGPGIRRANLDGWGALGNVAFDVHDYFGGRWGTGLLRIPGNDKDEQVYQDLYASTLAGSEDQPVIPYIGTTLAHVQWLTDRLSALATKGMPILVGEFGVPKTDPGAELFFGTTVSALQYKKVSWSVSGRGNGIQNNDGSLTPYAHIVIDAAKQYP